jgi:hypothetical protein
MERVEPPQPSAEPTKSELVARLRPGAWSEMGFLGADESLEEVLARDAETMVRLGLSYDELADALDEVMTAVLEMYRKPVPEEEIPLAIARQTNFPNLYRPETIPRFNLHNLPDIQLGFRRDHLQVFVVSYKGWQECPWGDAASGMNDFMIVNRETGESVTAPELMPHLVRAHHFFEGLGTPFRTDPERLARVLGLVVG